MTSMRRPSTARVTPGTILAQVFCLVMSLACSAVICHGAGPKTALASLVGAWKGSLTYRDYQSDGLVSIPAEVDNTMSRGGDVLISEIAFTDPGRVIRSLQMTSIASDGTSLSTVEPSEGPFETETLEIESWVENDEGWEMVLGGEGRDGGRPASFRIARVYDGGTFTSTKSVRYKDEDAGEWSFRNEISLERVVPNTSALVGTWRVDLRPTPDADPYFQDFVVEEAGDSLSMTFYGAPAQNIQINADWGEVEFAFSTEDGSGTYSTSGRLVGDRLEGRTHALGREFLSVWTAERK